MIIERPNLPVLPTEGMPAALYTAAEVEDSSPGISRAQILHIARAYRKHSSIAAVVLIAVSAFLIKSLPHAYVATATLIVSPGDKDPLAHRDLPVGWEDTFIPTQIDLIQSPVVLQPVVDRLDLTHNLEFTGGFTGPQATLKENVLTNLRDSLSVTQGEHSELLYISATAKWPTEAAAIANAVASEYLRLNRQRIEEPAAQLADRYSQELARLRAATIQAQGRVTAFRQQHGMVDLSPDTKDDSQTALDDLSAKLLAAQNDERNIKAALQGQSAAGSVTGSAGTDALETKLSNDQVQLATLRASLGARHPAVIQLESQIEATKKSIHSGLVAQLTGADKLVQQYQAAVDTQRQRVLQRRQTQDQAGKLVLELQSAQAAYKRALDAYPEIEFASAGGAGDVSLVSRAEPPARAVKPDKKKYFLVSCALSLALAIGVPMLYELLINRRLRCRDDLERHFSIPVLAQLGSISARPLR